MIPKGHMWKAIGIVILFLLLFLLKDWVTPTVINALGGYTNKEVSRKIDTLQSTFDTIRANYERRLVKAENFTKVKDTEYIDRVIIKYVDKEGNIKEVEKDIKLDSVYRYTSIVNDSLIEGTIYTVINAKNYDMVAQNLDYKPKFPIIVKEYIPIKETITETLSTPKKPEIGIGVKANTLQGAGIGLLYQTKDNWQFQAGYDRFFGEVIQVGQNPVKGMVTLGIYKTF
jgi:hypothetical protein